MTSNEHPAYLWWDGQQRAWEDATVHVTELGWSTVGAVFEGIRAYRDADLDELYVFRLQEHLDRLERSMKLVRMKPEYSDEVLTDVIIELLRANDVHEDTYIRPLAFARDTEGKRFSQLGADASVLINTTPFPTHLQTGVVHHARISSWRRISEDVMPPRIKNLSNYRNGQLASTEARMDGYDTAILLNARGTVAEGPGSCLMMIQDGVLITPDANSSILESITRDALMVLAREVLEIPVIERAVDRTELYMADEVFMCGTAAEITPVVSVDKHDIGAGAIGPITEQLEQVFLNVLRGKDERYAHWLTPVYASVGAAV